MPLALDIDQERLAALCRRYHVATLELFGSQAKGTARPDSDVDLLVTFVGDRTPGLGATTPWSYVLVQAAERLPLTENYKHSKFICRILYCRHPAQFRHKPELAPFIWGPNKQRNS
jgi:hypothetical protein